jgi:hypothetical protein
MILTKALCDRLFFCSILVFFRLNAIAQGSVNIEYFDIDSINQSFIGKEIRIDFKSTNNVGIPTTGVLYRDTFVLKIKNDSIKFVERWITYPDQKLLREQSFRSRDWNNAIQIHEMILEHIDTKSIQVRATIYDLDSSYIELDKKKLALENNIREIDNEISSLDQQVIGIDAIRIALEDKKRSLERAIRKLNREVQKLDRYWNEQDKKKNRIERIVIDKSIIDGIMTKE